MYEALARVYDKLTRDMDHEREAARYLKIITGRSARPAAICDCGCGTGSAAIWLAREGIRVIAVDTSEEMLRIAQEKALCAGEEIRFARQDMRELCLAKPQDAVISICDGVNYLTGSGDAKRFFEAAAGSLKPGGVIAFDISTREKLAAMDGEVYFEDSDDITWMWRNELKKELLVMDLTFFLREAGGRYRRHDERHVQKLHDPRELIKALEEAGFGDVRTESKSGESGALSDPERLYFSAVRK